METQNDLIERSKKEDGVILGLLAYGKPYREAVVMSANERNAEDKLALALRFEEHDKTGSYTVSTIDGQKELPWVLAVRAYFHGEILFTKFADPELARRIQNDRSVFQEKRAKGEKSVMELLNLTR